MKATLGFAALSSVLLASGSHAQSINAAPVTGVLPARTSSGVPAAERINESVNRRNGSAAAATVAATAGATVTATAITPRVFIFEGNTVVSARDLSVLTSKWVGQNLDISALIGVTDSVTSLYRLRGYAHASAFIPEQKFLTGVVTVRIVEATLGNVRVRQPSDPRLRVTEAEVKEIVTSQIRRDTPVSDTVVMRSVMLVEDLAAVSVRSNVRRSDQPGKVDLDLVVTPDPDKALLKFTFEGDNFGDRAAGASRVALKLEADGLMHPADVLTVQGRVTSAGTGAFGEARYVVPIGSRGIRAGAAIGKLSYSLGGEFAALEANGEATAADAFVSYPLVRSPDLTINARAGISRKSVSNAQPGMSATASSVNGIRLQLSGGLRGSENVSIVSVDVHAGNVKISDPAMLARDQGADGHKTSGSFQKLTFEGQHQQHLSSNSMLLLKLSGQLASTNLSGVEKFSLGGPERVRGYASGEGSGDSGFAATLEMRTLVPGIQFGGGGLMASVFYDFGRIRRSQDPDNAAIIDRAQPNERNMSSFGVGVRFGQEEKLVVRADIAHTIGARSGTGAARNRTRLWVQSLFWF